MTQPASGVPDEPTDPKSIMFKTHASNAWVIGLTVASILATTALLLLVVRNWPAATGHPPPAVVDSTAGIHPAGGDSAVGMAALQRGTEGRLHPAERDVLLMIILMGALGGLVHLTSSFAKFVGNRQLYRSWIVYYLLMPVEGAALAPMIYLLLRAGVLSPAAQGESTKDLNLVVLYGFAGLTGLFAKQAIEMLADVFSRIFKKVEAKDSLEKDKQAGAGKSSS